MEPKTIQTSDGPKTIIDEICQCGHLRSAHADRHQTGHGACSFGMCDCSQFTWKDFVYKAKIK